LNWYFPVGIGRYFLVFTVLIPKEILVGTFWYHFLAGTLLFPQKGGTDPLFDTASPPFAEKRSSDQTSNTDRNTDSPFKSDTGKIPIPNTRCAWAGGTFFPVVLL
jgi:hypothetical protein